MYHQLFEGFCILERMQLVRVGAEQKSLLLVGDNTIINK